MSMFINEVEGEDLIDDVINSMEGVVQERALILIDKVKKGQHDIYC